MTSTGDKLLNYWQRVLTDGSCLPARDAETGQQRYGKARRPRSDAHSLESKTGTGAGASSGTTGRNVDLLLSELKHSTKVVRASSEP